MRHPAVLFAILLSVLALNAAASDAPLKDTELFDRVKASLVFMRGNRGAGTGFVLNEGGRRWIVSNEHVARLGDEVTAVALDGRSYRYGKIFEVAENRDLVRCEVTGDVPALDLAPGIPTVGAQVSVLGNSDGGGVITHLKGRILGVGDATIETDAKFVHGNSGSPIVDEKGRVVGVATYARRDQDAKDWIKADTRFNDVRRFGVRLRGVTWKPVDWEAYAAAAKRLRDCERLRTFLIPVCFGETSVGLDYDAESLRKLVSSSRLRSALSDLVKADRAYRKAIEERAKIEELRKRFKTGEMRYPSRHKVDIAETHLRRAYLASLGERRDLFAAALAVLSGTDWPCAREAASAERLRAGFRYCLDTFDEVNAKDLSELKRLRR